MTKEEIASKLDGTEYGGAPYFHHMALVGRLAKDAGLLISYGQSDDLLEFDGIFNDEVEACDGKTVRVDRNGVKINPKKDDEFGAEAEECLKRYGFWEHALANYRAGTEIRAKWNYNGHSWWIEAGAPHAPFTIMEDGEPYCRGVVVELPQ